MPFGGLIKQQSLLYNHFIVILRAAAFSKNTFFYSSFNLTLTISVFILMMFLSLASSFIKSRIFPYYLAMFFYNITTAFSI